MTSVRTPEERAAVTSYLKNEGGAWTKTPPDYTSFSRLELSKKLEEVRDAVLSETGANPADVNAAYEQSQYFIDSSFDFYEGKKDLGRRIGRVFMVPMRSTRWDQDDSDQGSGYASESTPFYPLLDPTKFGVSSDIRMRTMYGLPPTVLDTYLRSSDDNETGALVLTPLYADMIRDFSDDPARLAAIGKEILVKAAQFVHFKLGADYVGLGATLPLLTNFGNDLKKIDGMENLTTTTGHGGTVYMIGRTTMEVMARSSIESGGTVGVIGGVGSIGWSTVQTLRKMLPKHKIHVYDKREEKMAERVRANPDLHLADSVADIFRNNNYIVSAITEQLDLDAPEYQDIDFSQIKVIDDSQPGAIDKTQIERRGGQVFWVAGKDESSSQFMTKDGYYSNGDRPYNYGDNSGLYGESTEFACGLEAAVVAARGDRSKAVTERVQYRHAEAIGELFDEYGVKPADFQAFSQPVTIK